MAKPLPAELKVALPLWALATVLVGLHLGAHSPYTVSWAAVGGDVSVSTVEGQHVNPDALSVWPLTVGFTRPCGIAYHAPNVLFPLHALFASVFVALTRSYMIGHWLLNLGAIALLVWAFTRACLARGLETSAALVAGALVVSLPWIVCYAGQPLHYLLAGCVAGCVVLAAIEMGRAEDRSPWRWGACVAVLTLAYDWYVLVAALVAHVVFQLRFSRRRDVFVFFAVGFLPTVAWHAFLGVAGGDQLSTRTAHTLVDPIFAGYAELLSHPLDHALELYVLPHVGLDIGFRAALDAIGWPLVLATLVFTWKLRKSIAPSPGSRIAVLLLGLYVAEQVAIAALDVENSSRRALPAAIAVVIVATWIVGRVWASLPSRVVMIGLAALSVTVSLADRITDNPALQELGMGEVVRGEPKLPPLLVVRAATPEAKSLLTTDGPVPVGAFHPVCDRLVDQSEGRGAYAQKAVVREARPANVSNKSAAARLAEFLVAQAMLVLLGAALLVPLARTRLVPRYAPHVAGAILLVSYVARAF